MFPLALHAEMFAAPLFVIPDFYDPLFFACFSFLSMHRGGSSPKEMDL